jgi:magnesium chelatase subunit H
MYHTVCGVVCGEGGKMRILFLTMDGTHGAALREAATQLAQEYQLDLQLQLYYATSLRTQDDWQRLAADAAAADFIFGARLFGETYVRPLQRILAQTQCPVCIIISNPALIRCTRLGKFVLQSRGEDQEPGMLSQFARKFRPRGGSGEIQRQLALLRNVGKVLKHIPGRARDVHTYIVAHEYWAHSSPENLGRMLALFIDRYIPAGKGRIPVHDPLIYPDVALLHPDAPEPFTDMASYEKWQRSRRKNGHAPPRPLDQGSVALLSLRTVALSGNMAHLHALVRALEARGIEARIVYSSGLDFRPAIEQFCRTNGKQGHRKGAANGNGSASSIDLLINGTGFSLVGGPAESRPDEASAVLASLDVPCFDMFPLSMQRIEEWRRDDSGLIPIHLTMNVAIPELDGAVEPLIIGGPQGEQDAFVALDDQIDLAARRVAHRVGLRRKANADKHVAVVLFSFPPTLGNIGTAAYLDVFGSLYRLLCDLRDSGYTVEMPESVEALQHALAEGNAMLYGTDGNVADFLPVSDYLRLFAGARDIEPLWGRAPGELLNDGKRFYILGLRLGNVFVGIQPSFGYERDPMRLLMAKDAAPHHGFAAFYTWIEHVFGADAVVHLGTHGALEFMPGKQAGLSSACWPTRLLGSLPNIYYYSVNNPSEGTIARRRGAATLVSYMVPPLQQAGLYKGLRLLKDSLERYRQQPSIDLLDDIRMQAERLGITLQSNGAAAQNGTDNGSADAVLSTPASADEPPDITALAHELIQIEQRMIPVGLHVLGQPPAEEELVDMLALVATFVPPADRHPTLPQQLAAALGWDYEALRDTLKHDRAAQDRWERLDAMAREAVRLFVADRALPAGQREQRAAAYLGKQTGLEPAALAALWAFLGDLLHRIVNDQELEGLRRALNGGYVPPSPGSDIVRNPAVVPTGRNIYGLDPFNMPSALAQQTGTQIARDMLARIGAEQGALPETVAIVLWGIDNLKSGGEGIAQVLALLGARMVRDELGKAADVELIPLDEIGHPRIDVVVTVSGIFRDLLHHQMVLLDRAAHLAANADEPPEQNFVRKHALAQAAELGVSLDEAATRIFANAPGSYGANVNHLVESGTWDDEQQLSDAFLSRKSFSFRPDGAGGEWHEARTIMERALSTVDATFQNIDSFEVGISDIDYYYESLGGVTKSVELLRGKKPPVLVADAVSSSERLASLEQMVRLETRAKLLNPRWFEAMLAHGSQGVREIEARVNNTYGWSVTAEAVEGWAYQGVADTFLLDPEMRERLANLNPHALTAMTRRLLEASARGFWDADDATIAALQDVYDDLEDRLEGVAVA